MPIPLSAGDQELYDRILSYCDSLVYVANYKYIREPTNRRELVETLRGLLPPNVHITASLSANHRGLYDEMLRTIRSVRTDITGRFMQHSSATRDEVVEEFANTMNSNFYGDLGCGDLCPDKERGCVECT